jgi:transposase
MALFWLTDDARTAIELHLPKNQPGARRVDARWVISGILHVLKVGCRWCECSAESGPSTTVYNRFNRWFPPGLLAQAVGRAGRYGRGRADHCDRQHIHQGPTGSVRREGALDAGGVGRSRGGWTTKVHALTTSSAVPMR